MGDFNSRLPRNEQGFVGRWCIHTRSDSGGDRLLHIMKTSSLRGVSTYYQPRRNHTNATFINVQPAKAPSQIDYILISKRWATSARNCTTTWGLPIRAYGRKYDHGLVSLNFQLRLKCVKKTPRRDFKALQSKEVAKAHEALLRNTLAKSERPTSATEQWKRLTDAMCTAQDALPVLKAATSHKWEPGRTMNALIEDRLNRWESMTTTEWTQIKKEIGRAT